VIPVVPVKPAIKEVEDGFVVRTPDRTKLFEVQTPEGFKKEKLLDLYKDVSSLDDSIFDESILFERAGLRVKVVEGDEANFKITTPFDLLLSEVLVKDGNKSRHRVRLSQICRRKKTILGWR